MLLLGIVIGAVLGAIATILIAKNNKELLKSWIDKLPK